MTHYLDVDTRDEMLTINLVVYPDNPVYSFVDVAVASKFAVCRTETAEFYSPFLTSPAVASCRRGRRRSLAYQFRSRTKVTL